MKETAQQLLKAKVGKEKRKFPYPVVAILILSLVLLGTEDKELIPWGMLFLGISVGAFLMDFRWRKNGKLFWEQMKHYIDWSKVEADAKDSNSNQPMRDNG